MDTLFEFAGFVHELSEGGLCDLSQSPHITVFHCLHETCLLVLAGGKGGGARCRSGCRCEASCPASVRPAKRRHDIVELEPWRGGP